MTASSLAALPFELAQEYGVLPIADEAGALVVATAPHMSVATLAAARQRLGRALRTQPVTAEAFRALLTEHYARRAAPMPAGTGSPTTSSLPAHGPDLLSTATGDDDAPAVRLVSELMRDALAAGASDIHLDATERGGRVRFRIDGVLGDVREADAATHAALIARCKVMATLDIAERRLPQDGRLAVNLGGHRVDVRVATLPTQHGERAYNA